MPAAESPANRGVLLGVVLFAVICVVTFVQYHPPPAKASSAPPGEFSAGRARDILYQLVGDGIPHPVGSDANAAVRERILEILTKLGYQPEVQPGFGCNEWGVCGSVKNVVARLEGAQSGEAVMLVSHYDSVPAGPGASDDGMAVAAELEIARILKTLPAPRHPIILLITDGEEAGMLGAEVFVNEHPWARDVKAAVNVEARGTSGPSLMFETGSANEWTVRLYAASVPHPITNSIFYTVYKRLPNDTDFTVFKGAGYQGLNFAIIGDVTHYHTPLDNFENASPGSLQHQGDNALSCILALADAGLANPPAGEAVYFDFYGRSLVLWGQHASFPIAATVAFLLLVEIALLIRRHALYITAFGRGVLGWLAMAVFTGAIGYALLAAYRVAGAVPPAGAQYGWIAHPIVAEIAYLALAVAGVVFGVRLFQRRSNFWGYWSAWNVIFAIAAIWTSRYYPGTSFMFVVPNAAAVISALPAVLDTKNTLWRREIAVLFSAAVTFSLFVPTTWFLYDAMGVGILPFAAVIIAIALATLAPAVTAADDATRSSLSGLMITIAVIAGALGFVTPTYSVHAPQRVNFSYWLDADSHQSKWLAEANSQRLSDWLAAAAPFQRRPQQIFPWDYLPRFSADAPKIELGAPEMDLLSSESAGTGVHYRARLRSRRGAPDFLVYFPPSSGVTDVAFDGHAIPPASDRVHGFLSEGFHGWRIFEFATMPDDGVVMDFALPSASPVEAFIMDESYALPPDGNFLRKARPPDATPSQSGDTTDVTRRVEIRPVAPSPEPSEEAAPPTPTSPAATPAPKSTGP